MHEPHKIEGVRVTHRATLSRLRIAGMLSPLLTGGPLAGRLSKLLSYYIKAKRIPALYYCRAPALTFSSLYRLLPLGHLRLRHRDLSPCPLVLPPPVVVNDVVVNDVFPGALSGE